MVNLQISSTLGDMRAASLVDQEVLMHAAQGAMTEVDEFSDFDLTILLTDDEEMSAEERNRTGITIDDAAYGAGTAAPPDDEEFNRTAITLEQFGKLQGSKATQGGYSNNNWTLILLIALAVIIYLFYR